MVLLVFVIDDDLIVFSWGKYLISFLEVFDKIFNIFGRVWFWFDLFFVVVVMLFKIGWIGNDCVDWCGGKFM